VWLATGALGCTAETSGEWDDSSLRDVSEPLEQFIDRPAVAALGVGWDVSQRDMWLFVCRNDNLLHRGVRSDVSAAWGPWEQAASTPCAGVPTAGAWSAQPQDDVEVFYRSTTGHLIELYYGTDGATQEVDLSIYLGLGSIKGNPVIADMGTHHRIAVAVRDSLNRLKTLTYAPALGWVIQPVTNAAGQQVYALGLLTAMYTSQVSYLSSSLAGTYQVFTRSTWTDPYVAINSEIPDSRGVLTFTAPTPSTMFVINRDGSDRVTKSPVVPGQPWNFTLANRISVLGTPYLGASWLYDAARNQNQDRGLGCLSGGQVSPLWGLNDTQKVAYINAAMSIRSAGTRPVNGGDTGNSVFFAAAPNYRIYSAWLGSVGQDPNYTDLGINVLVP